MAWIRYPRRKRQLLEMYDFTIFGHYASSIGTIFFSGGKGGDLAFPSIMLSQTTFSADFLTRQIGVLALASYIVGHGRRAALTLTLALMSTIAAGTIR